MSMVDIDWRPSPRELRKFGVVVMIGFGVVGAILLFASQSLFAAQVAWAAGGVLGLPALTGTVIGLPGYWLWMGIAFVMGNVVSRLLLTLIYYGLVTPIGLLRRLLGHDPLQMRRRRDDSYWHDIEKGSGDTGYERLF